MARINIEDSIYKDLRFLKLFSKCGDMDKAIGSLVRAWSLAQKWWLTEERTIPLSEWESQEINSTLIEVGLAERINDRVRMRGSLEQFSWLTQRSIAGRKGGLATAESRLATAFGSKPPTLSLPLSPSLKKETTTTGGGSSFLKEVKKELQEFWTKTYKDQQWIDSEIAKCEGYCLSTNKQIKNLGQFINSWLHKSFEAKKAVPKQLKAPSNPPPQFIGNDPRGKPLAPELKTLLNKALRSGV